MSSKDGGHREFRKEVSPHVNTLSNVEQRKVNTVPYVQRAASCFACCIAPRGHVTGRMGARRKGTHACAWCVLKLVQ